MAPLFFADNTVLVNFALVGRLDLLEGLLRDNGRWCRVVSQECERSSRIEGLKSLADVGRFLGNPVHPEPVEQVDTLTVRTRLVGPHDSPTKSLGEAETVAALGRRFAGALFITDDRGAQREGERLGVQCVTTGDLLLLAVKVEHLTPQQCTDLLTQWRAQERSVLPECRSLSDLMARAGLR